MACRSPKWAPPRRNLRQGDAPQRVVYVVQVSRHFQEFGGVHNSATGTDEASLTWHRRYPLTYRLVGWLAVTVIPWMEGAHGLCFW